ncbi:MAG: hypothetical protein R3D56_05090 [Paracoccaceae bacterium]
MTGLRSARYRLSLNDLRIDGTVLKAQLGGSAWLKGIEDGWPEALVAQIRRQASRRSGGRLCRSGLDLSGRRRPETRSA